MVPGKSAATDGCHSIDNDRSQGVDLGASPLYIGRAQSICRRGPWAAKAMLWAGSGPAIDWGMV